MEWGWTYGLDFQRYISEMVGIIVELWLQLITDRKSYVQKRCLHSESVIVKHHSVFMVVFHPSLVVIFSHAANVLMFL